MTDPEALFQRLPPHLRELLDEVGALARAREEPAWLVGGSVRDLILRRDNEDVDIVVEGDGMALAQALSRARSGTLTRHHAFGTARVDLPDGLRVDFATARGERYPKPGDLPRVSRGTLQEDLARRDFTINAIALGLEPGGERRLADPFDGVGDLDRERIRFLHEGSFRDDPTRTLRALRFALRFGYRLEERTETALRDAAVGGYLEWLSGDRLRRELAKLLQEAPVGGPARLEESGLLVGIHPGLRVDPEALARLGDGGAGLRWPLVLAVMALDMASQARWELVRRLRLSREQRIPLVQVGQPLRRLLRLLERQEGPPVLATIEALEALDSGTLVVGRAVGSEAVRSRLARAIEAAESSRPELDGDALLALGCAPGPGVGEMLARLRTARLAGAVSDVAGERALVRDWLAESGN